MIRRPPRSTRTDPLFPDTTLFRSRVCGIGLEGRLSGVDQSISLNVRLRHSLLKFPVVCRDSGGLNESEVESRRSPLVKMHGISDTKQTGDLKQIDGAVGDIR